MPPPLKLISSMATREILGELIARYPRDRGEVIAEAAGGVEVAQRIRRGEAADVVVLASNAVDQLIEERKLLGGSRVDLVKSGIAMAVRAGAARPEIGSEEAVKNAVLAARTLSYSTGPSGVYLDSLFRRWGIFETLRDRLVVPPPGVPVGSLVADGRAALGFQQLSEFMNVAHVEVLGPLPPAIQSMTIFSAGVAAGSGRRDEAAALAHFMASPPLADIKIRHGMEPV